MQQQAPQITASSTPAAPQASRAPARIGGGTASSGAASAAAPGGGLAGGGEGGSTAATAAATSQAAGQTGPQPVERLLSWGSSSSATAAATPAALGATGPSAGGGAGTWQTHAGQLTAAAAAVASQRTSSFQPQAAAGTPTVAPTARAVDGPGAIARPALMHLKPNRDGE